MQRFVGRYERQVDDKGRVALPPAFRARLEPRCYLAFGDDGCVDVMTETGFEEMANEMVEKVKRGEIDKSRQRALAAATIEVPVDQQGRVLLSQELREFAGIGLKAAVVVAGSFDRVEIWNPDRFRAQTEAGGAQILGTVE
jgi:MraZ protein